MTGADLTAGVTQAYTYDLDGNRLTKTDAGTTTTYTYDATDELINQTISGTSRSFTYDGYGNLTQSADAASALTTYTDDLADRRLTQTPPGATSTSYTYDALGRIATRVTPSGTDTYSYTGTAELVWQVANATLTVNSAIDGAGNRTGVKSGSTVGLTLPDLHGSVAAELAQSATSVLSALRYDPYGLVTASYDSGASFTNPWRYRGRLDLSPDAANPVYDMGARDYLPGAGVFASLDTYGGQAADPRSMNRFLYAEANPATLVDPDGHAGCQVGRRCSTGTGGYLTVSQDGSTTTGTVHRSNGTTKTITNTQPPSSGGAVTPYSHDSWATDPTFVDPDVQAQLLADLQSGKGICRNASGVPWQSGCVGAGPVLSSKFMDAFKESFGSGIVVGAIALTVCALSAPICVGIGVAGTVVGVYGVLEASRDGFSDQELGYIAGGLASAAVTLGLSKVAELGAGPQANLGGDPSQLQEELGLTAWRGDDRSFDDIFQQGFVPMGSDMDLLAHAHWNPDSGFVATSRSYETAAQFGEYVYAIKAPGGIDVNAALGTSSPFPGETEIAYPGGVSAECIVGCLLRSGAWVPNPNFGGN